MIYDAFLYNGEKDLLRIRMAEMQGLDVQQVIVDSYHTFSGIRKHPDLMVTDFGRMPELSGPFCRHTIDFEPAPDPWENEKRLRNAIVDAMRLQPFFELVDDDIVIISDVDEIPRKEAVLQFKPEMGVAFLDMKKYGFFLNLQEGEHWTPPKIVTWAYLKNTTPDNVRNQGAPNTIPNGGWHFSWCGGIDEVMRKFASFSHQELDVQRHANREELIRKMAAGESLWGSDKWTPVPITDLPQYVQDHQEELKHLIFQP